jgi:hypothetical protein
MFAEEKNREWFIGAWSNFPTKTTANFPQDAKQPKDANFMEAPAQAFA